MLKVERERWGQSIEALRELSLKASHARTRERFMALYEICCGHNATQVGCQTNRNPQTVMAWVHRYNTSGPEALIYRHTGGHPPLCLNP